MSKKRGWLALALALVLLLSGCTYQKKADEAAKLIEEGKYAEAYEIYKDLEERTLMEETKDKAFQAAQEAFSSGDFSRVTELMEAFPRDSECAALLERAQMALSGTYVTDLKMDGSNLSFQLFRAEKDMETKVQIKLQARNETVSGWIYETLKPEDLPEGSPCTVTVDLNEIKWSASMNRVFSFYDNSIFTWETQTNFSLGAFAKFYKCVSLDGREGLTMGLVLLPFQFNDVMETFKGGQVSVAIYNPEGEEAEEKIPRGEVTIDLAPEAEEPAEQAEET